MLNLIDKCTEVCVKKLFYFLHIIFLKHIKIQLIQENQSKPSVLQCIVLYACVCTCLCVCREIGLERARERESDRERERETDRQTDTNRRKHKNRSEKKTFFL